MSGTIKWVETALRYLPTEVLNENKENLVFVSTAQRDACRVARHYCKNREVIILSERILPKQKAKEYHSSVRYFIFCVLHEIAHAVKRHKSPKFDSLTEEEFQAQEKEADDIATEWFNSHVELINNPHLKPITQEEIALVQQRNEEIMEQQYKNV